MMSTNGVNLAESNGFHQLNECKRARRSEDTLSEARLIQRRSELDALFEKKFEYKKSTSTDWHLPSSSELFKEFYQIEELHNLRFRLNEVKSKLNHYGIEDWNCHTKRKDPAGEIPWRLKNDTKAEFVTASWCKFFECLNRFPIVTKPKVNTLHLCEAPGAFIAALNHYLNVKYKNNPEQIEWKWLSTTLNPYYEGNPLTKMITDDRFLLFTLDHWVFYEDFTGNIIDVNNINNLQEKCKEYFNHEEVHLVTADGSIDCVAAPDCQEEYVGNLNLAEIVTALSILSDGGSFLIKFFTQFEATTVSKMYLLNCIFNTINVFKPVTSKRGNSEIYVICIGYKKNTENLKEILEIIKTKLQANETMLPLFNKKDIPIDFLFQHEICQRLFMNLQIKAIENNILTYEFKEKYKKNAHFMRREVSNEFYKRYQVESIPKEQRILYGYAKIPISEKIIMYKGSHSERELLKATGKEEQIFKLQSNLNYLEKSFNRKFGMVLYEKRSSEMYNKENLTLKCYTGTPIQLIHNSLFMTVSVLFIRNKFQEIFELDPLWFHSPHCDIGDGKLLEFDFYQSKDFPSIQQKFFVDILNEIITKKSKKITFKNFPFVTHYSVSILRYLYLNIYSTLTINTDPSFEITLEILDNVDNLDKLEDLKNKLMDNQRILCILELSKLHRNAFSLALIEFNNLLVIKNCNRILTPNP